MNDAASPHRLDRQRPRLERIAQRYREALAHLPPPGGNGCHQALLGVANLGVLANLDDETILADIHLALPQGTRRVGNREIREAIGRARADHLQPPPGPPPLRPPGPAHVIYPSRGAAIRQKLIERGRPFASMVDIWEASPIRIDWPPQLDGVMLLSFLYAPSDFVFIGQRHSADRRSIRPVHEWRQHLLSLVEKRDTLEHLPHIIPNPLSGKQAETKSGTLSWRADACVASFRFCVVEFDSIAWEDQLAFWAGFRVPVAALIDSGGKSIHAWLRVDAASRAVWEAEVEDLLFGRLLGPLGVDTACRNEARLSRFPGAFRSDRHRWQSLLYLAPEGRAVFP